MDFLVQEESTSRKENFGQVYTIASVEQLFLWTRKIIIYTALYRYVQNLRRKWMHNILDIEYFIVSLNILD